MLTAERIPTQWFASFAKMRTNDWLSVNPRGNTGSRRRSKNNLRGITLGIGPIWGITCLTFILSWYNPNHTGNVRGSCTIDFACCMSLISSFQNLITENYNSFTFFPVRERAKFNKSCNLFFLVPGPGGIFNPRLGWVSLCDYLKSPFLFLTPTPFKYRGFFFH